MSNRPEWFAPKRYGYGATPISWQGWALTFGFAAIVILLAVKLGQRPMVLFAVVAPLTVCFTVICARTTRGPWRWRWGEKD